MFSAPARETRPRYRAVRVCSGDNARSRIIGVATRPDRAQKLYENDLKTPAFEGQKPPEFGPFTYKLKTLIPYRTPMNLAQIFTLIPTRLESIRESGRSTTARARTRGARRDHHKGRRVAFSGCYFLTCYRPSHPSGYPESNNSTLQTSRYQPASWIPSL